MDTTNNWKRNTGPATSTFTECRVAYRNPNYVAFFAVYTCGTMVFCYSDRLAGGPREPYAGYRNGHYRDDAARLDAAAVTACALNGVRL